jgi:hypothetical protein
VVLKRIACRTRELEAALADLEERQAAAAAFQADLASLQVQLDAARAEVGSSAFSKCSISARLSLAWETKCRKRECGAGAKR